MATIPLAPLRVVKTVSGNSPWTLDFQEAISLTFTTGEVLVFDAAGRLTGAGADPTRIVGVASEPGHNYSATSTANTGKVWVADDDTVFVGNLSGSSVTALTDIGARYGLVKTGTNWHVDKTEVTNVRVLVIDLDSRDAVGDTNGRVHFMILGLHRLLDGTS